MGALILASSSIFLLAMLLQATAPLAVFGKRLQEYVSLRNKLESRLGNQPAPYPADQPLPTIPPGSTCGSLPCRPISSTGLSVKT
jgi:hypothetical protein